MAFEVVPLDDAHGAEAGARWTELWGSTRVASRGRLYDLTALPAFVALEDGRFAGGVVYRIDGDECEVVSLAAARPGSGAGPVLLDAAIEAARHAGCRRIWLITTNDNTPAQRFYERHGWRLVAVHEGAVDRARETLKPEIPLLGVDGIPIRDEVEYELLLEDDAEGRG